MFDITRFNSPNIVVPSRGAQFQSNIATEDINEGFEHFEPKSGATLNAPSPLICPAVCRAIEELGN